jgi:hypothetical protein
MVVFVYSLSKGGLKELKHMVGMVTFDCWPGFLFLQFLKDRILRVLFNTDSVFGEVWASYLQLVVPGVTKGHNGITCEESLHQELPKYIGLWHVVRKGMP